MRFIASAKKAWLESAIKVMGIVFCKFNKQYTKMDEQLTSCLRNLVLSEFGHQVPSKIDPEMHQNQCEKPPKSGSRGTKIEVGRALVRPSDGF